MAYVELARGRVDDACGKWTHVPSELLAARVPSHGCRLKPSYSESGLKQWDLQSLNQERCVSGTRA